jgi:hypothetical protein
VRRVCPLLSVWRWPLTHTMYPGIDNYFKQGYYRDYDVRGTGVVYHDGFRMNSAS